MGRYLDLANEAIRHLDAEQPHGREKSELSEERSKPIGCEPCVECNSTSWKVAVDSVCYDCLIGLTQMRRNGVPI